MPTEERNQLVRELLAYFPKTIVDRLMLDSGFRKRNDLETSATVSFPGIDAKFSRNELVRAVGRVFRAGSSPESITDNLGEEWEIVFDVNADVPIMTRGERRVTLGGLWFVATDDTMRRSKLKSVLNENRAIGPEFDRWRDILTAEPLDVEDIETFREDIKRTPKQVTLGIRAGISEGSSKSEILTPRGIHYYERLVGSLGKASTITEFAEEAAKTHFAGLLEWNTEEGLRQALLSGSHSSLLPLLPRDFDPQVLERVLAWAVSRGDRISQVAAFELGLRHVEEHPALMSSLVSIAEQIRDDDPEDPNGRLLLLSNLFAFVDGSVAHLGYLRDAPPFWRRLASIAQASLIEREFIRAKIRPDNSTAWLEAGLGTPFFLQNSIDGRKEPRWVPDFCSPQQWKLELSCRVINACERHNSAIVGTALERLSQSSAVGSLRSQLRFPYAYMPGPLEGGVESLVEAPQEFQEIIRDSVSLDAAQPVAFNALVNTCLVFRTPIELAQQAAESIKAAKYRVRYNAQQGQNFATLSGLALVAAVTRSQELAREVRILTRLTTRRIGSDIDAIQSFRIGIVAANAFSDTDDWRLFLGEWITELAFGDLNKEAALRLHGLVEILCDLEPALWATLSKAEAALCAFINAS